MKGKRVGRRNSLTARMKVLSEKKAINLPENTQEWSRGIIRGTARFNT